MRVTPQSFPTFHSAFPGGLKRSSGFLKICFLGVGDRKGQWYTTGVVKFYSAKYAYTVVVPPWFITDLASIPKGFHWLISDDGYERFAAVIHDWLCVSAEVDRKVADEIFYEACFVAGVPTIKNRVMYRAVRAYSVTAGRNDTYNRAAAHRDKHFVNPHKAPKVNRRKWITSDEPPNLGHRPKKKKAA